MIIVSGKIYVKPGQRKEFIQQSRQSIFAARQTDGCDDFAVSPDPIEELRVNIYEKWHSMKALQSFRESGPDDDLASLITSFHVAEYKVVDPSKEE